MRILNFFSTQKQMYSSIFHDLNPKKLYLRVKKFNWRAFYEDIKYKLSDLPKTNYNLALYHLNNGNLSDAILRFKITLRLDPSYKDSLYYIGLSYYEQFKFEKAINYFQKYLNSKKPLNHEEEAKFCIQAASNKPITFEAIPLNLTKHRFNQLANIYDSNILKNTHSPFYNKIIQQLNASLQQHGKPFSNKTLDLGCGPGTIGLLLRENKLSSVIDGVEISKSMAKIAKSDKIDGIEVYNNVFEQDIKSYLQTSSSQYDLIIASDVLGCFQDPSTLIKEAYKQLAENGILALIYITSNKKTAEFDQYIQQFKFSNQYIKDLASTVSLHEIHSKEIAFDNGQEGELLIVQKKS